MQNINKRYHELDWLRVILIFTVFLHHVFMPFNGDDWHIMNNESSKLLDDIMVYFEQFRLPILFLISGAASAILLERKTIKVYTKQRILRLFIPLMVGILIVVPPQNYLQYRTEYGTYLEAWPKLAFAFETNHLWFIEYLIIFVLLAIPFNFFLKTKYGKAFLSLIKKLLEIPVGLLLLAIPLLLIRVVTKMYYDDSGGIENLSRSLYYFYYFLGGMLFISSKVTWESFKRNKTLNLYYLMFFSIVFYAYYYSPDLSAYASKKTLWSLWWALAALISWSASIVIIGYAQEYLNFSNKKIQAANLLIYPFYIFHQTVIVIFAYFIVKWDVSIFIKASCLLISSFLLISILCKYIVEPFNFMRVLFGVKKKISS